MATIIGIDPGKKGAIVVLRDGEITHSYELPLVEFDFYVASKKKSINRTKVDCLRVFEIIDQHEFDEIWVEDLVNVEAGGGWNAFNMGRGVGRIEGALEASGLELNYIRPGDWTRVIWRKDEIVWEKKINKKGKEFNSKNTKATSLNAYKRLFKDQMDKVIWGRKKKAHDGIVDAALIAFYGEVYGHSLTRN